MPGAGLDSLLMLTTTETVVAIDVDYDHEMCIGAAATIINSLLGGQPVYSQTKFTQVLHFLHCCAPLSCQPSPSGRRTRTSTQRSSRHAASF